LNRVAVGVVVGDASSMVAMAREAAASGLVWEREKVGMCR
jgi:hypothetical protein